MGAYYHDASGSMTNDTVTEINMPTDLFGCQGGLGVYVTTDSGSASRVALTMTADNVNNYDKNGITCDDPGTCAPSRTPPSPESAPLPGRPERCPDLGRRRHPEFGRDHRQHLRRYGVLGAAGILVGNPQTLVVKKNTVTHNDTNIYVLQDQSPRGSTAATRDRVHQPGHRRVRPSGSRQPCVGRHQCRRQPGGQ